MKLICIEGIDAVGKETTSKELEAHLKESGFRVERVSFPRYDKPIGAAIREILNTTSMDAPTLDADLFGSMYTLDRIQYFKENIERLSKECDYLILDRGFYSNLMYQGSKLYINSPISDKENLDDIDIRTIISDAGNWIITNYKWEIVDTGISEYAEDVYTFILSMPIEDSEKQIQNRTSKDSNESNKRYLNKCKEFIKNINRVSDDAIYPILNAAMKSCNECIAYKYNIGFNAHKYYFEKVYDITVHHEDTPEAIHESIINTINTIDGYLNLNNI